MDYQRAEKEIKEIVSMVDSSRVLQGVVNYLYQRFDTYSWVGIYIVKDDELVLGPWKGPQATEHTRIPLGEGVCGAAARSGKTEIVADVSQDHRYLSCFLSTRSEIVVPIKNDAEIIGEIDIDSDVPNAFTQQDAVFLENIASLIRSYLFS
jgi:GAF domain-containing protein